jgi:hypothetical protein
MKRQNYFVEEVGKARSDRRFEVAGRILFLKNVWDQRGRERSLDLLRLSCLDLFVAEIAKGSSGLWR